MPSGCPGSVVSDVVKGKRKREKGKGKREKGKGKRENPERPGGRRTAVTAIMSGN
jgi:hypothetical protein